MYHANLGNIGVACAATEDSTSMLLSAVERSATDFTLVDRRDLHALEITLMSIWGQVEWSLDNSIEDLRFYLQEKDLKAEKTRQAGVVAYIYAMDGCVAAFTLLLLVVKDKISAPASVVIDVVRTKRSIYSSHVDESALEGNDSRKALLCEIQLLNQFRASPWRDGNIDRRTFLPLLRIAKVGDVCVTKMLLRGDVDVNETDMEGNMSQEPRIVCLVLKNLECCDSWRMNRKQRSIYVATSQDMLLACLVRRSSFHWEEFHYLNCIKIRNHSSLQKNYVVKKQSHTELLDYDFDDYDDVDFNESYTVKKKSEGHPDFLSNNFSTQGDKSERQSAPKQGPKFPRDLRTLFIDSPVGRLSVRIRINELCSTLRKIIEERLKTSIQNCTLRAGCHVLENNKSLHSYGLSQHSVVQLHPRLLGGQPPAKRICREKTLFDYINDKSVRLFSTRTIPSTTTPNQNQNIDEMEPAGRKLGRSLVLAFLKVSLDRKTWNGEISLHDFVVREGCAILSKIPTACRTSTGWTKDCGSLANMLKVIYRTNARHFVYLDELINILEKAKPSWMFQDWFRTYLKTHFAFKASLRRSHVTCDIFRMYEHFSPAEQAIFENDVNSILVGNWTTERVQTNHIFEPTIDYRMKKYGESYELTSFDCFQCVRNYCTHGKKLPWDLTEYAVPFVVGNFICDVIKELLMKNYAIEKLLEDD